jgi:hypothetical protein
MNDACEWTNPRQGFHPAFGANTPGTPRRFCTADQTCMEVELSFSAEEEVKSLVLIVSFIRIVFYFKNV